MSILQMQDLGGPSADDPMETDADRRVCPVEDIDIDLDLTGEQEQNREDAYMSEDIATFNDQEPGTTQTDNMYNDDEMADEADLGETVYDAASVQDEDIQDAEEIIAAQADEDDEIIDVVDDEPLPLSQSLVSSSYQEATNVNGSSEQNQGDEISQPGSGQEVDPAQLPQSFHHSQTNDQTQGNLELLREQNHEHFAVEKVTGESQKTNLQDIVEESSLDQHPEGQQRLQSQQPAASDVATQALSQNIEHSFTESSKTDAQRVEAADNTINAQGVPEYSEETFEEGEITPSPLDAYARIQYETTEQYEDSIKPSTHTHAAVVIYQGAEISLFRPADGDREFFLDDQHLAYGSITNLMAACRQVLGEDVHELELTITIDDLDLQLNEFENEASNITISQLVDLYIQLQHHDGIEPPQDIRLNLTTKPSFSRRLEFLRSAIEEGKGLSQVQLSQHVQEENVHFPPDQKGEDDDSKPQYEALIATEDGSHQPERGISKAAVQETEPTNVLVPPAVENEPVLRNDTSESRSNHTIDAFETEGGAHETTNHKTDNLRGKHFDFAFTKSAAATDPSSVNEPQPNEEETPALADDNESIIDYDEEQLVRLKASSKSSILQGDVKKRADRIRRSSDQTAAIKEVLPGTDSSSHTLEGSFNDPATYLLHVNDEDDGNYARNVEERTRDLQEGKIEKNAEVSPESEAAEQEDEPRFTEEIDHLADVEGDTGNEDQNYDDITNENEYGGSFEGYQGAEYESEESQPLSSEFKDLQSKSLDTNDTETYVGGSTSIGQQASYEQTVLPMNSQENDDAVERDHEEGQGAGDFIEDPTAHALDEDRINEPGESADAEDRPRINDAAQVEDEDQITYEDEEEPAHLNFEQDEKPSPESLKRSRIHSDADNDATAEDLQDAKRVRST